MIKNLKRYKKQLEKEGKTEEAAQYIFNIDIFNIDIFNKVFNKDFNKDFNITKI